MSIPSSARSSTTPARRSTHGRCRDRRRGRADPGLRRLGPHARRAPADDGLARRAAVLRPLAGSAGSPAAARHGRLRRAVRLFVGPDAVEEPSPARRCGIATCWWATSFSPRRKGGEFTGEDEKALVLFAAQAATAVANAPTYRNEHRARARFEALVETSPVGGRGLRSPDRPQVSLNQEARRIVGDLSVESRSLEQLLDVVVCRRADGQEVALSEFSLAQVLPSTEVVRAEEMTLEAPRRPACQRSLESASSWTGRRPQHVGGA